MAVLGSTTILGNLKSNGLLATNSLTVGGSAVNILTGTIASNTSSASLVSAAQVVAYIQAQTVTPTRSGNTVSWGTGWVTANSSTGTTISPAATYYTTTNTGFGQLGVGWNSSTYYIKAGSATTPTNSTALSSSSTSLSSTTLTVQASVTPTVSAGWINSGTAGTVKISGTVPNEAKTANSSGDVTPTSGKLLTKVTVPAGTAGNITGGALSHGDISVTAGGDYLTTSGSYAIKFSNTASRAAASYSITTAGWISSPGSGLSASGDDTKTLTKYIKAGALADISGGALTHSATTFTAGSDYLTDTNTGYALTASNTASVSQITAGVTTAGWIPTTASKTKSAVSNDTKTITKYIKASESHKGYVTTAGWIPLNTANYTIVYDSTEKCVDFIFNN